MTIRARIIPRSVLPGACLIDVRRVRSARPIAAVDEMENAVEKQAENNHGDDSESHRVNYPVMVGTE
jgi:hypothetical protein